MFCIASALIFKSVAPVRERGLKYREMRKLASTCRRSRKGAWIEIETRWKHSWKGHVAPVRERGLKFLLWYNI